jgi:predicted ATP-grasp superfamily ATP-dependent carboligase
VSLYAAWETPEAPNLMLQEVIPGPCDRIWMLSAYFGADGQLLFAMTARKLREYPASGGVTCLGVCEHNPEVLALCQRFMGAVGYRGILDLDFKWDERTRTYKALDANPRVGANFRLFVDPRGNDVVRACYRELTGQGVPAPQPNEGRKWMVEDFDCAAALHYLRAGQLGLGGWLRSFRGLQETAWLAPDDPLPALARTGKVVAELLQRASVHRRRGAGADSRGASGAR